MPNPPLKNTGPLTGPLPLIAPGQLEFIPDTLDLLTILDQELGDLGTDKDGFDQLFNDAATLAGEAGTVLDSLDPLLTDASAVVPEFDTTAPADLAAQLKPASDAADIELNTYNTTTPVNPNTGGTGTGGGNTNCKPPAGVTVKALKPMDTSEGPIDTLIDGGDSSSKFDDVPQIRIECGDPSIFSIHSVTTRVGYGGNEGPVDHTDLFLRVTPGAVRLNPRLGPVTFYAIVRDTHTPDAGGGTTTIYYSVEISFGGRIV